MNIELGRIGGFFIGAVVDSDDLLSELTTRFPRFGKHLVAAISVTGLVVGIEASLRPRHEARSVTAMGIVVVSMAMITYVAEVALFQDVNFASPDIPVCPVGELPNDYFCLDTEE